MLIFKEDGNFDNKPTPFHYALLEPNGTSLAPQSRNGQWKATALLEATLPWEGPLIEAPWVILRNATYFLFYSGNGFGNDYAVGVARSSALLGPYEKRGAPILAQANTSVGAPPFEAPGHCSVVPVGGAGSSDLAIVYHAWLGNDRSARHMMLDALQWDAASGWPYVAGGVPGAGGFLPSPAGPPGGGGGRR